MGTYTASDTLKADIRNNVIYNNYSNGYGSGASSYIEMNYVGNYIIAGPETSITSKTRAFDANATNHFRIYQSGNKIDSVAGPTRSLTGLHVRQWSARSLTGSVSRSTTDSDPSRSSRNVGSVSVTASFSAENRPR